MRSVLSPRFLGRIVIDPACVSLERAETVRFYLERQLQLAPDEPDVFLTAVPRRTPMRRKCAWWNPMWQLKNSAGALRAFHEDSPSGLMQDKGYTPEVLATYLVRQYQQTQSVAHRKTEAKTIERVKVQSV